MTAAESSSFAVLLRRYRIAAGLIQEELAERVNLSVHGISNLKRGKRHPYRHTLAQLADALVLSPQERARFEAAGREAPVRVIEVAAEGKLSSHLPPAHPTNLPDEPTPFIGREREIEQITGLLHDPHIRMVTLTGPGGVGKTRLALQVATTLLADFRDGVFFVNLAPLADPILVPSTIAEVLGVKEEPGRDLLHSVIDALKAKRLLLVLDNYEHLLDATSIVGSLLDGCRALHALVTSRIPLHLSREHQYAVLPLTVPDPQHLPDIESLSRFESVALLVDRARAVMSDFELDSGNSAAVAEICFRLDGLPLALELAAARIKLFPPQALLQRLSSRLKLLTGGARDSPTRQQTLRAAVDWSYSLLSEQEQTLFTRLGVFAGGCTFEAVEAVCNPQGGLDLLEGMAALVDQSLLRRHGEEVPRYSMLQTVREYATEKLREREEQEDVQRRYAEYFLQVAEQAEAGLSGAEQGKWMARLNAELSNVRGALRWFLDQGAVEQVLRLAAALFWYWRPRGSLSEGRRWLQEGLARGDEVAPSVRAKALWALGYLAGLQGDSEEASLLLEEALKLYRALEDGWGAPACSRAWGWLSCGTGGMSERRPSVRRACASARIWGTGEEVPGICSL